MTDKNKRRYRCYTDTLDWKAIRRYYAQTESAAATAAKFGIAKTTVLRGLRERYGEAIINTRGSRPGRKAIT